MSEHHLRIELVTSPGCTNCDAVRTTIHAVLSEFEAEFVEVDITDHPEYVREYRLVSAPAVIINGQREFQGRVAESALRERIAELRPPGKRS